MADQQTQVPGIKIRRIRQQDYVVVDIKKTFGGGNTSIKELAHRVRLQPQTVLQAILRYRSNAHAIRPLYRDEVSPSGFPGMRRARQELRKAAVRPTANSLTGGQWTETPYIFWSLNLDFKPLVLPRSAKFQKFLKAEAARRERQRRLKAASPSFKALEKELSAIRVEARVLHGVVELFRKWNTGKAKEVALLAALDGMLGVLIKFPKSAPSASKLNALKQLRTKLQALQKQAYQDMVVNPPDLAATLADRDKTADTLLKLVEKATFVQHIRLLAQNPDIAPHTLMTEACDTLRQAFIALLISPKADHVIKKHVEPLLQMLASKPIDMSKVKTLKKNPNFDAEVRKTPVEPAANSALVTIGALAAVLPRVVGNMPGSASMSVGVLQFAAPIIIARIAEAANRNAEVIRLGAWMYRTLTTVAGLKLAQRVELLEAVADGNLARLRKIDWSARFMNSPAWGGAIGVAGALTLILAFTSDDAKTLRKWSNIIAGASTTTLGFSVALQRYSTLIQQGIVKGIGGKALGVVGGVAAVISGVITAQEEYKTGDTTGAWLAGAAAAGGALSVAGFLIAGGAASSSTGVGATVGVVMMVAGVIIGIGAAIWDTIRNLTTAGGHRLFEAFINHFGRTAGPYDLAATHRPKLKQAFEAVQTGHHNVDFWDARSDKAPELYDVGLGAKHIALVVDKDEAWVKQKLKATKRIK